jgi:uncharacterized membrane-anchored protein YitT (DUF2179 family)
VARRVALTVADYLTIAVGSIMVALAADYFLIPNQVVSGGITGIGTLLHYTVGTPVGLLTLLINIPLLIADLLWGGGWVSTVRTLFSVTVMSLAIDLLQPYVTPITHDPLLYTLFGGLVDGLGIGLVFRAGGTTGGTDILARLAHRFLGLKLGHTLLATNLLILGAAGLVFGLEPVLYAILLAYVSSQVIDLVQEGFANTRTALIVSQEHGQIRQAILEEMSRGVTLLHAEGGYSGAQRPVLLCAVRQAEISRLKRLVQRHDQNAFMIVMPASEVVGEGFKGFSAP